MPCGERETSTQSQQFVSGIALNDSAPYFSFGVYLIWCLMGNCDGFNQITVQWKWRLILIGSLGVCFANADVG